MVKPNHALSVKHSISELLTCPTCRWAVGCAQHPQGSSPSLEKIIMIIAHPSFQANTWKTFAGHLLLHLHTWRPSAFTSLNDWLRSLITSGTRPCSSDLFITQHQMGPSCLLGRGKHCVISWPRWHGVHPPGAGHTETSCEHVSTGARSEMKGNMVMHNQGWQWAMLFGGRRHKSVGLGSCVSLWDG